MPTMPLKWSMNDMLRGALSAEKRPKLLMIVGLIGIMLIFISSLFPKSDKKEIIAPNTAVTAEEYRTALETQIRELVEDITGDRKASVVVTLDSGIRYSYADATEINSSFSDSSSTSQQSSSKNKSYITVQTADGGEQALVITEYMPDVRGVAIVCSGGNNEQTAEKIRGAVMAALQITSKRVYITGGNGYEKR